MIHFTRGDIFTQPVEALVNPVNCAGVMGRGLALQFRRRFPNVFLAYRDACARADVQPGRIFLQPTGDHQPRWIAHFPTKRHWRDRSRLADIDAGLRALATIVTRNRIRSLAVPPLGCGLGSLAWHTVRPLIAAHLSQLDCRTIVLEP